jgi:hypothetical protein
MSKKINFDLYFWHLCEISTKKKEVLGHWWWGKYLFNNS